MLGFGPLSSGPICGSPVAASPNVYTHVGELNASASLNSPCEFIPAVVPPNTSGGGGGGAGSISYPSEWRLRSHRGELKATATLDSPHEFIPNPPKVRKPKKRPKVVVAAKEWDDAEIDVFASMLGIPRELAYALAEEGQLA